MQPDKSLHNFFEKIPTTKDQQSNNTLTISSKSNPQSRISVVVNSKPNRIMPSLSNRILPKQTTVGGPRLQLLSSSSSPSSSLSLSSSVALKQSQWPNRIQTRLSARGRWELVLTIVSSLTLFCYDIKLLCWQLFGIPRKQKQFLKKLWKFLSIHETKRHMFKIVH